MDPILIKNLAKELYDAESSRVSISPLTDRYPTLNIDNAYAIQLENVKKAQELGHVISGKKIGLTSSGIQQQMGVNEPDYGHLFSSMNCPNGMIEASKLIQPKIEAELAFILKSDLTGGKVTIQDVHDATDYVVCAFEIVDSRVVDWKIKLIDTVSDNASSGRYILGKKKLSVDEVSLPDISMKLFKNGNLAGQGFGKDVLENPCAAVAWLANRLWSYGIALKKDEVILSGAFSAAPIAKKGDKFEAQFSSFGTISAEFI